MTWRNIFPARKLVWKKKIWLISFFLLYLKVTYGVGHSFKDELRHPVLTGSETCRFSGCITKHEVNKLCKMDIFIDWTGNKINLCLFSYNFSKRGTTFSHVTVSTSDGMLFVFPSQAFCTMRWELAGVHP